MKWLLYEKIYNNKFIIVIDILFENFGINNINNIIENDLNKNEIIKYKNNFDNFINNIKIIHEKWILHFLMFFEYNSDKIEKLIKNNYEPLFKKNFIQENFINDIDSNSNLSDYKYTTQELLININNIKFKYIYLYLKNILTKFKKTWYGRNMFLYN